MSYNKERDSIYFIYENILQQASAPNTNAAANTPPGQAADEVNAMDPETFKLFETRLIRAKFKLFSQFPFFGLTLQKLKTVIVTPEEQKKYGIDTMAVDDNGNIYINANFVINDLTDPEIMGVLAHEVMHIATLSFVRQRGRDQLLWNVATDYIMNRDLLEQGIALPKLGCLPAKDNNDRWIVNYPYFDIKNKGNKTTVSGGQIKVSGGQKIAKIDVTDMTAEQLYDELTKYQIDREAMKELLDQLDKHLSPKEGEQIKGQPPPNGDPVYVKNSGEGKTESQKHNELKGKVQQAAQQAKQEAQRRGTDAGLPRSFDKRLLEAKVNWKQLLKNFITGSTTVKTDWTRENRRLGGGHFFNPRRVIEKNELQAVIGIDTSGSISESVLRTFISEIAGIINSHRSYNIKMIVMLWDVEVYAFAEIDTKTKGIPKSIEELKNLHARGGGTEISSMKTFLDKKYPGKKIKGGLLVFTDGHVENNPSLPDTKKKMFFITMDGTDKILKKYGPTYFIDVPHS
jgi:predicted metal-dependent peptidase